MSAALLAGTFLSSLAGSILPWINGELVLAAAALASPRSTWPIVAVCVLGQMAGKLSLYALARWFPERLPRRFGPMTERARGLARRPGAAALTVFTSSAASLPPFYLVTLGAGVAKMPLPSFAVAGLLGVSARYCAVAWGAAHLSAAASMLLP